MAETTVDDGEGNKELEVAPALIAVHPLEKSVVVAAGAELRVYDLEGDCPVTTLDDSGGSLHVDSIRAIRFGAKGRLFASAGDDKLVKIWTTDSWRCLRTVCSEKRVSAVAISHDGHFVCFADKFGVIWVVSLDGEEGNQPLVKKEAAPILAHYCSIITSLEFSPDGRFIVSADRDFKIRVTVFPQKPFKGAHEIQSFCLGHTEFVTCLTFLCTPEYSQGFLLSGGGDSTVRLWDIISGSLLHTCEVGAQAELLESNGDEVCPPAVIAICPLPSGSLIAVATQILHGVMLLNCDLSAGTLSVVKVVSMGDAFIATSLAVSSAGRLWTVTGASNIHGSNSTSLASVKVLAGFQRSNNSDSSKIEPIMLEGADIPGGEKMLEKLQGCLSLAKEEKALAAATEAVKMAMRNLLIKKQYSLDKRELRKKSRNDRKLKQ